MFKNIKKYQKYIIVCFLLCVVAVFAFIAYYHYSNTIGKVVKTSYIQSKSINNTEITTIKEGINQNQKNIEHLVGVISAINKSNINSDKYTLFLTHVHNIHHRLYTQYLVKISLDINTIQSLSKNDITLSKLFSKTFSEKVYGIKYFHAEFNNIVREVHSSQLSSDDTKLQHFFKKHITPHFVYISPNGSHISRVFHNAHLLLESGAMKQFYSTLQNIDSKNPIFKEYLHNLEDFLLVKNSLTEALQYIENSIVTEEDNANTKIDTDTNLQSKNLKSI